MAKAVGKGNAFSDDLKTRKKTSIGNGKFSKHGHKSSCSTGGKTPKGYRKKYRGQGKRR